MLALRTCSHNTNVVLSKIAGDYIPLYSRFVPFPIIVEKDSDMVVINRK